MCVSDLLSSPLILKKKKNLQEILIKKVNIHISDSKELPL